jgi:hypothetical protein
VEQAEYGERGLEENGGWGNDWDAEKLEQKIAELNDQLAPPDGAKQKALQKLERECLPRQVK